MKGRICVRVLPFSLLSYFTGKSDRLLGFLQPDRASLDRNIGRVQRD